jgi:hypothetical protein
MNVRENNGTALGNIQIRPNGALEQTANMILVQVLLYHKTKLKADRFHFFDNKTASVNGGVVLIIAKEVIKAWNPF